MILHEQHRNSLAHVILEEMKKAKKVGSLSIEMQEVVDEIDDTSKIGNPQNEYKCSR
jgi:hypothetical protein